jgi:hypothetical protein
LLQTSNENVFGNFGEVNVEGKELFHTSYSTIICSLCQLEPLAYVLSPWDVDPSSNLAEQSHGLELSLSRSLKKGLGEIKIGASMSPEMHVMIVL